MGQQEVYNTLKENLFLNIQGIKKNQKTSGNGTFKALTQMTKYNEIKGLSVNDGNGHRIVLYSLTENYKKALKEINKLYSQYGEVKDFIPIAIHKANYIKKTKLGRLGKRII